MGRPDSIFVTGGSQGYGRAIASRLTKAGYQVMIAARDKDRLEKAAEELGCEGYVVMDVTVAADWDRAYKEVTERLGGLDILINNAGGGLSLDPVVELSVENIDRIVALNLSSAIYGSRLFGRLMKGQNGGTIINIASVCANRAWGGLVVYGAAKAGLVEFSKGLYVELQPYNVRVSCLIPAAGATDFFKHAGSENVDVKLQPEDVAAAVVAICELPDHVVVEEMTVWGIDQVIEPF